MLLQMHQVSGLAQLRSRLLPSLAVRRAVAGALEDAQVGAPRTDRIAILVGHDAGELMEMGEVVNGPGREKLRERDHAEGRMRASPGEVFGLQIEGLKRS